MKDNTKFYIVTIFVFLILTLVALYWVWFNFGKLIKVPPIVQPVIEETETPQAEDSKAIWCLENPIDCKG